MKTEEKSIEKNYEAHIDSTVKAVEDHVEKKSVVGVSSTINKWIETLADHKGLKTIASNLDKLKDALESKDTEKIVTLLETLGEQTTKAADEAESAEATKIKHLGKALTTASKAIPKFV